MLPLAIYGVAKVVGAIFLILAAKHQVALGLGGHIHIEIPTPASPSYTQTAINWDGQWYATVVRHGYPSKLPIVHGIVAQNQWAFFPLYPTLVKLLMLAVGWAYPLAAVGVSTICGAFAVSLMHTHLARTASRFLATACTASLCAFMSAPILQVAYTESLALLLITLAIRYLDSGQLLRLAGVAVLIALTRQIVIALGIVIVVHALLSRRHWNRTRTVQQLALGAFTIALTWLWPTIAGLYTGRWDAYLVSVNAWRSGNASPEVGAWFRTPGVWESRGLLAFLVIVLVVQAAVVLQRDAALWGLGWRLWVGVYSLFFLVATGPGAGVFRYLLLCGPGLWPFPGLPGSPSRFARLRVLILICWVLVGFSLQWLWVRDFFTITGDPSKGAFP